MWELIQYDLIKSTSLKTTWTTCENIVRLKRIQDNIIFLKHIETKIYWIDPS